MSHQEVRPITGYEGRYSVTADGRVFSHPRRGATVRWLTAHIDRNGYRRIYLFDNGRLRSCPAARLVLTAFASPAPTPTHQANHLNGVRGDDRIENLEWASPVENTHHAIRTGLIVGRSIRLVEWAGRTVPVSELPHHPSVTPKTVSARIFKLGWSVADAIAKPQIRRGHNADGSSKRPGKEAA